MYMQSPFGGFKQSGWGREKGEEGIEGVFETKCVLTNVPSKM